MGSVAMIYAKFHKDWFRHTKVDRGDTPTHRQHDDHIILLLIIFFQNKESRLKRKTIGRNVRNEEK
jgi:hypothetical protein